MLTEAEAEHAFGCAKSEAGGAYAIGELRAENYIVHFEAPFGSGLNFVSPDVKKVTGHEPRTLEAWFKENAAAFK